jgi:hypothetical protein
VLTNGLWPGRKLGLPCTVGADPAPAGFAVTYFAAAGAMAKEKRFLAL